MRSVLALILFSGLARGHIAAFTKGMYCRNGTEPGVDNQNTNDAVQPLYNLTRSEWWMHHSNKCDQFPPLPGDFLEVPARGSFSVELAGNRAQTSFSYGGRYTSAWGDGKDHPDNYSITNLGGEPNPSGSGCLPSPNLHTQNETMAAGTAFAISYESDITRVTEKNLVVFTVAYHTPFKLLATYKVPDLPACPPGGCHCVWGWVPNHCGQPNMYMFPHRCKVTGATSTTPLAPAKPPAWCEDDQSRCVQGPKQMIFWNQLDGNNVITEGLQLDGDWKSPAYNMKNGFKDGAQTDIFAPPTTTPTSTPPLNPPPTSAQPTSAPTSTGTAGIPRTTVTTTVTKTISYCAPTQAPSAVTVTKTVTKTVSYCPSATSNGMKNHNHRRLLMAH